MWTIVAYVKFRIGFQDATGVCVCVIATLIECTVVCLRQTEQKPVLNVSESQLQDL
jgi:hypothetical protein